MKNTARLKPAPSTLYSIFLESAELEKKKTAPERIQEQLIAPFFILRGATRGTLRLLEQGISPLTGGLQEGFNAIAHPKEHARENAQKGKAIRTSTEAAVARPLQSITGILGGVQEQLTQKAKEFLLAPFERRAEMVGEAAPSVAFMILSGKFPGQLKLAKPLPNGVKIRKVPLGLKDAQEFRSYGDLILKTTQNILKTTKDKQAFVGVRGSSVTGQRFRGGLFGPDSDLDFFVVSNKLFLEGVRRGARGRKGMLYVGDTRRYFNKELGKAEQTISASIRKNPEAGPKRKATIRIFSQKGFENIQQGLGKEILQKPGGALFWFKYRLDQVKNLLK